MYKKKIWILVASLYLLSFYSFSQVGGYPIILSKESPSTVDSLNNLADSLLYLQIRNPFPLLAKALQIAETIGYKRGTAECYFNIAQVHRFITNDHEKAIEYYDQSIELIKNHDFLIYGRCLIGKSAIAQIKGEIWRSRSILLEASNVLIKGNDLARSLSYEMRSYLFDFEMDYDSAHTCMLKALILQKKTKQAPRRIAHTLSAISDLAIDSKDSISVKTYLPELITISSRYDLRNSLAFAYYLEAKMLLTNRKYLKALNLSLKCVDLEKAMAIRTSSLASYYLLTGKCYLELKEYESANGYLRKSLALSHVNKKARANIFYELASLFERQSKFDSAFYYSNQSEKLLQEMSQEGRSNLNELEAIYNSKLRNQENALLQNSLDRDRIIIISISLVLFSTLLLTYLLYLSRKKHKGLGQALIEKNAEISTHTKKIFSQREELALHSQMLEASNANLKHLDEAGKAIIGSLDINQIIDISYHKIGSLMKLSSFGVGIYDKDKESLYFPRVIKENRVQPPFFASLIYDTNVQVWSFLNIQSVCISDLYTEQHKYLGAPNDTQLQREEDVSLICSPLFYHQQATGVIYVGHQSPNAFSEHDLDLIKNIANYVSIAIENSKAHDRLVEEHARLLDSNTQKDKLMSIITHDIKGPMNSLKGFLQLLSLNSISSLETEVLTKDLKENFSQTLQMVDSVLFWASSQMNGMKVSRSKFDISLTAKKVIEALSEQLRAKQIAMKNDIAQDIIFADEGITELIIRNLITNAIKFTNIGGQIVLSSVKNPQCIEICIEDNGVGISEFSINKLFQIKSRFSTRGTQKERGTGLGLYLCKEFITAQGGEIWVESKVGAGSKFYFSLPRTLPTFDNPKI